jgi:hypothetical protein
LFNFRRVKQAGIKISSGPTHVILNTLSTLEEKNYSTLGRKVLG